MEIQIRVANENDAQFVHDVYGYYVYNGNVTFSTQNPDVESYRKKILHTLETYPFYICEVDGKSVGFAYGGQIRPHDAYRWGVEGTVYLAADAPKRMGLGRALYGKLLDTLQEQGFQTVYGVITENNEPSLALHRAMGFTQTGHFLRMGYKNGSWLGVIWMQKEIGTFEAHPKEPVPFPEWKRNQAKE